MKRRTLLQAGLGFAIGTPLVAQLRQNSFEAAAGVLDESVTSGQVTAASLFVRHRQKDFSRSFGAAENSDAIFLLASISKTISITAVMTLFDRNEFRLDDQVTKFIPEFTGDGRERITMQQLFTHTSGLPDQLAENAKLRASHAPLAAFVKGAIRTPLLFSPGSEYGYSSMGILLATEVTRRITGKSIASIVEETVCKPLELNHLAMGLGNFRLDATMQNQVEKAAPESGAGDPASKNWDWNSSYWRNLGAPWGAAHGSAPDVGRFLDAFLHPQQQSFLKPDTAMMMVTNHNAVGMHPRGLGFDLGNTLGGPQQNERVFGHTGSTGTLCWADPITDSICVVLTTLPARAVSPHPRDVCSQRIAAALR